MRLLSCLIGAGRWWFLGAGATVRVAPDRETATGSAGGDEFLVAGAGGGVVGLTDGEVAA